MARHANEAFDAIDWANARVNGLREERASDLSLPTATAADFLLARIVAALESIDSRLDRIANYVVKGP